MSEANASFALRDHHQEDQMDGLTRAAWVQETLTPYYATIDVDIRLRLNREVGMGMVQVELRDHGTGALIGLWSAPGTSYEAAVANMGEAVAFAREAVEALTNPEPF